MARVTTEDCIDKVPNRFDLVMLAAFRAREISSGDLLTVSRDNDKNPVVALREIAEETQLADDLRERTISNLQQMNEVDEPEQDQMLIPSALVSPATGKPVGIFSDAEPVAGKTEEEEFRRLIEQSRGQAGG